MLVELIRAAIQGQSEILDDLPPTILPSIWSGVKDEMPHPNVFNETVVKWFSKRNLNTAS